MRKIKKILRGQKGQAFIENLLYIILFCFVIGVATGGLATATQGRFTHMTNHINTIGS